MEGTDLEQILKEVQQVNRKMQGNCATFRGSWAYSLMNPPFKST